MLLHLQYLENFHISNAKTILESFGIVVKRFGKSGKYQFYLSKWKAEQLEMFRVDHFARLNKDVV